MRIKGKKEFWDAKSSKKMKKLTNATIGFVKTDDGTFVLLPLGTTAVVSPTNPSTYSIFTVTFNDNWEFEYDEDEVGFKDSSSPIVYGVSFIGARPTGR